MTEWLIPVIAALGGFLVGNAAMTQGGKTVEVVIKEVEREVTSMGATLEPLYTAMIYVLLSFAAAGVIAFVVWTFMQVFGEKKPGKEV